MLNQLPTTKPPQESFCRPFARRTARAVGGVLGLYSTASLELLVIVCDTYGVHRWPTISSLLRQKMIPPPPSPPLALVGVRIPPSTNQDWRDFYENDPKYKKRGILAGRFYDARGRATRELKDFEKCARAGQKEKDREAVERKL